MPSELVLFAPLRPWDVGTCLPFLGEVREPYENSPKGTSVLVDPPPEPLAYPHANVTEWGTARRVHSMVTGSVYAGSW